VNLLAIENRLSMMRSGDLLPEYSYLLRSFVLSIFVKSQHELFHAGCDCVNAG